jgi:hypothetical protein
MDRSYWRGVLEADGVVGFDRASEVELLTSELISYLSSPDPELRDGIGFSVLANWICTRAVYSGSELASLVSLFATDMFVGIGTTHDDSVLGFSAMTSSMAVSLVCRTLHCPETESFSKEVLTANNSSRHEAATNWGQENARIVKGGNKIVDDLVWRAFRSGARNLRERCMRSVVFASAKLLFRRRQ